MFRPLTLDRVIRHIVGTSSCFTHPYQISLLLEKRFFCGRISRPYSRRNRCKEPSDNVSMLISLFTAICLDLLQHHHWHYRDGVPTNKSGVGNSCQLENTAWDQRVWHCQTTILTRNSLNNAMQQQCYANYVEQCYRNVTDFQISCRNFLPTLETFLFSVSFPEH